MKLEEIAKKIFNPVYAMSPERVQKIEQKVFKSAFDKGGTVINYEFIDNLIGKKEFERFSKEFEDKNILEKLEEKKSRFYELVDSEKLSFGSISEEEGKVLYSIIRKEKPQKIVETGVCNGVSTWIILEAIKENSKGRLYSIDYPFYADESLELFRDETFDGYGGAAIPEGKEPGWIIPDELRDDWKLIKGKSQRELPSLLSELEEIDFFIHDSEHSLPCMIFEYEIALEYLKEDGMILSDDITWNEAFKLFSRYRDVKSEQLSNNIGAYYRVNE